MPTSTALCTSHSDSLSLSVCCFVCLPWFLHRRSSLSLAPCVCVRVLSALLAMASAKPPAFSNQLCPPPTPPIPRLPHGIPRLPHDSATKVGLSCCERKAAHEKKNKTRRDKGRRAVAAEDKVRGRVVAAAAAAATAMRLEGVDEGLSRMAATANLDQAPERRRLRDAFREIQLGIDHCLFKKQYVGVKSEELYEVNSRGLQVFSKSWLPENSKIKALVCFCHGYGDTCTFFFEGIARKLASSGFGVFAMDYPGFGLSDGLHGYIERFDSLVDDVIEHFSEVKENPEYQLLPSFLFGQSMGGAVALKVHLKQPHAWDGAVLVAPMCKIADDVVPPWPLVNILICVAKVLPKQKLVPQKDLAEMAFKDLKKREQTSFNVIAYKDKPRLRTALELLRTTQAIGSRLEEVSLPLLILHGEADIVTDPSVSKALYEKAKSPDKQLRLYKDAYHSLLEGEPDEMIFKVLDDIVSWLDEHAAKKATARGH